MTTAAMDILTALKDQQAHMIDQLHQICLINSGSTHLTGLANLTDVLSHFFSKLADEQNTIALPEVATYGMDGKKQLQQFGNCLWIRKRPHLKRRVLLCGHLDTVYAKDNPFQTLTQLDKHRLQGPGVADMKGGIIVMLHALQTFEQMPEASSLGWDILLNSDEELGSPASSALIDQLTFQHQAALVYEPALDEKGTLAKNRKGSAKFTLIAKGLSAHAGRAFHEGHNAITFLASVIGQIEALNHQKKGITLNVGLISGGDALNVVPDWAVAKIDVRVESPEDESWVQQQFALIQKKFADHACQLEINGHFHRPAKRIAKSTTRLYERIKAMGKQIGIHLDWQDSGGCCDGNNLAAKGLPTIDTLGVRGGAIHSPKEYIVLDSLSERAALSALILLDLAAGGLEELHTW